MVTKSDVEKVIEEVTGKKANEIIENLELENGTVKLIFKEKIDDATLLKVYNKIKEIKGIKQVEIGFKREVKEEENVNLTEDMILEKLKEVIDPEIGIDVVNLGLIYELKVNPDNTVYIKMTMTTPGCPLTLWILRAVEEKVLEIPGVKDVEVELTFDPPWTPDRMSEEAKRRLGMI
ncbi:metal-sulfur cluster assembly factor [Pyrococcus abyssi]|uniref:Component of ring hydroxylating complex, putative n=1 Tax=Pyrococcus abyssi (strain GE5 / Orsay) TaxID=272844 RepID=Q9UY52_PYRAB|nr:metal-sulfur cluster assembly factor [Pyrococcus abyssi]CAB50560.1 Component of ring hydroxylating complex, putative [Pyrococcus abyssi GE5]CCE71124.1 TPA: dTDP-4-keto-l-rhamnose reductase related [Pyrococcus abyssi GE5]